MKVRVEAHKGYVEARKQRDVIALLAMIKELSFNVSKLKYPAMRALRAWRQLVAVKQQHEEQAIDYFKRFTSLVEAVENSHGTIAPSTLAKDELGYGSEPIKAIEAARERMLAALFIAGASGGNEMLIANLEKEYSMGIDKMPQNLAEAVQLLAALEESTAVEKVTKEDYSTVSFAQISYKQKLRKGLCFKCGKKGHKKADCPLDRDFQGVQNSWMG